MVTNSSLFLSHHEIGYIGYIFRNENVSGFFNSQVLHLLKDKVYSLFNFHPKLSIEIFKRIW
ncbi:MAG: hypothetical protein H0U49_04540 [Parachlamydiaceae bacterium]|nr:hypothetical protein [Parachlamydiaceae bacterium]